MWVQALAPHCIPTQLQATPGAPTWPKVVRRNTAWHRLDQVQITPSSLLPAPPSQPQVGVRLCQSYTVFPHATLGHVDTAGAAPAQPGCVPGTWDRGCRYKWAGSSGSSRPSQANAALCFPPSPCTPSPTRIPGTWPGWVGATPAGPTWSEPPRGNTAWHRLRAREGVQGEVGGQRLGSSNLCSFCPGVGNFGGHWAP